MMEKEAWFQSYGPYYSTNGYEKPPWKIYEQFLKVVQEPGAILELGCGNGLLLRYLCDLSDRELQPFGVDINAAAIHQARTAVFPNRRDCFVHADLRDGIPFQRTFATILANPLYADQGYYEQVDGKIRNLYLDGSMEALIQTCRQSLSPGGQLILWCYDGHIVEIAPRRAAFNAMLAGTGVSFREVESGPVSFWVSECKKN
jgi:tRNA1(Val) A37 N6-methylase TrmN6